MELLCPGCQKKLSLPDQFAGQLVKCPLCAGMFSAPALAPQLPKASPPTPSAPPPAPAPAPPSVPLPPVPALPPREPPTIPFASEPPPQPPQFAPEPAPPELTFAPEESLAAGEFSQTRTWQLRPDVLRWVTPICLTLLFLLSFFPWAGAIVQDIVNGQMHVVSFNLWELAFGTRISAIYGIYLVFVIFLLLPLTWVKRGFEKNWVPLPEFLEPAWPWRGAVVGGILLFAFLFPLVDFLRWNIVSGFNSMALGMKIALRVHLVALIASGVEFWLERRKKGRLPLPDMTIRW